MNSLFLKNKKIFLNRYLILSFYIILCLIAISVKYFLPKAEYTYYENYVIFKNSFLHLIQNKNLYISYPAVQWDLFKYSPTFAAFMSFFAYLPNLVGLWFWTLANALIVFFAVSKTPLKNFNTTTYILWFVLLELLTSVQSAQSNGLVAGLMVLTFCFLEEDNLFMAACMAVSCTYIKIFGITAIALFIFYPGKFKSALYLLFWTVVLFFIPLLFTSFKQLLYLYSEWLKLLSNDHQASYGMSVMAMLKIYFNLTNIKQAVPLVGALFWLLPLIRYKQYKEFYFRLLFLSSTLIWVVIFNHKAESPTFIIAICGVAFWYFTSEKSTANLVLLLFTFLFTCLSPTDLFPASLRKNFTDPYVLKMLPCFFVWIKIQTELLWKEFKPVPLVHL